MNAELRSILNIPACSPNTGSAPINTRQIPISSKQMASTPEKRVTRRYCTTWFLSVSRTRNINHTDGNISSPNADYDRYRLDGDTIKHWHGLRIAYRLMVIKIKRIIHAPAQGATLEDLLTYTAQGFLSTHPHKVRPKCFTYQGRNLRVSIHAPA